MKKLKQRITDRDPVKNAKFEKRKSKLTVFRKEDPGFDSRIRESRQNLIEEMKDKKRNK